MRERERVVLNTGPGRTKQSFKDSVDVNKIVARYHKTGMLAHVNGRRPFYGDVSEIAGYQEALNVVNKANELFMGMSSAVRERFANNPERMIAFLQDESNLPEAIKLGMVVERPEEPKDDVTPPVGGGNADVPK